MEFSQREADKIDETHDAVIVIKTVLLGKNSDKGLVGDVEDLKKGHGKLKKAFWLLVGTLPGLGVLGTGINYIIG